MTALPALQLFAPLVSTDSILLPAHLDGSLGRFRPAPEDRTQASIDADNDLAAIRSFLAEATSEHTRRAYEKEIMRIYYWAVNVQQKAISDLTRDDYAAYEAFLMDPQPSEYWCGPKRPRFIARALAEKKMYDNRRPELARLYSAALRQFSGDPIPCPEWRPFEGPLNAKSREHAMNVIRALLRDWTAMGYLVRNPLLTRRNRLGASVQPNGESAGTAANDRSHQKEQAPIIERFLTKDEQEMFFEEVERWPQETHTQRAKYQRARYLLTLLLLTGGRIGELERHTYGDMRYSVDEKTGDERWWLRLVGKGSKLRIVPIPRYLLQIMMDFREFHRRKPLPVPGEDDMPLLPSIHLANRRTGGEGIKAVQVNRIIKTIAVAVAARLDASGASHRAAKIRCVSAHWFRHSYASDLLNDKNVDLKTAQDNLGHATIDQLFHYRHLEQNTRHDQTNGLTPGKQKQVG